MTTILWALAVMMFHSCVKGLPLRSRSRSGIKLGSSLIMDIPVVLRGLEDIASRYDVILFDQFGVLHDGRTLFPGVLETLKQLKSMNKTLGVVSNTSRRSAEAIKSITKLGIPTDTFDSFVTSGELAYNHLSEEYSNKDASCTVLTWKGYQLSYLTTLGIKLAPPEAATFVYLHGSESMQVSEHSSQSTPLDLINTGVLDASVETMLRVALRRQLPLLCANSDHTAVTDGRLLYMPGLVAERYEQMGGTVLHFGKPYAPVFDTAIDQCLSIHAERKMEKRDDQTVPQKVSPDVLRLKDQAPSNPMADRIRDIARRRARSRILHVGDSLTHDILGAKNSLIDSLLISSHGVHRDKLHPSSNQSPADEYGDDSHPYYRQDQSGLGENSLLFRVCQLCDEMATARPTYILPAVQWVSNSM